MGLACGLRVMQHGQDRIGHVRGHQRAQKPGRVTGASRPGVVLDIRDHNRSRVCRHGAGYRRVCAQQPIIKLVFHALKMLCRFIGGAVGAGAAAVTSGSIATGLAVGAAGNILACELDIANC